MSIYVLALLAAAASDLVRFEIPNMLSLALIAAFLLVVPTLPTSTLISHATAGAVVFTAAALLFALGVCGGGDVKLLGATALWVGWDDLATFLLLTALCGAALALILLVARQLSSGRKLQDRWYGRLLAPTGGVPYGVAIAVAGLALLLRPAGNVTGLSLI